VLVHISKSKFIAGRQCLKREWLQINQPQLGEEIGIGIKEQGNIVGALARSSFPGGVLVETLDFDKAVAETANLMKDLEVLVIFEAAFRHNNLRVRLDVEERCDNNRST
jgi:hypothetical protein